MATAVETALNEYLSTTSSLETDRILGYYGVGDENKILISGDQTALGNFYTLKGSEKYSCDVKNMLNTHALPYSFTLSATKNNNTTFPEVAMMFIKTYIKQLLPYGHIKPNDLYKVFNRNQELVELPYPVVLYLGGLHYFLQNVPNTSKILENGDLFNVTNGIPQKYELGKTKITSSEDLYESNILSRMGLTYATDESTGIGNSGTTTQVYERLYAPSMKVLNRSLYDLNSGDDTYFSGYFNIKTSVDGEQTSTEIPFKTIMPAVGFGIQNRFLNHYNKIMFGDYLNGTKDLLEDGQPHSVIGAFCGISKPIKTYKSYDMEFTAFYRNLHVGAFSYKVDDLVTELDNATKGVKTTYVGIHPFGSTSTTQDIKPDFYIDEKMYVAAQDNTYVHNPMRAELEKKDDPIDSFLSDDFPMSKIIQAFVTYSKLKAIYLNKTIGNKAELTEALRKLCSVKNIESVFNKDKKAKGQHEISDFYFLVSHVFFASYKKVVQNHETPNGGNYYSLNARLNFGMGNEYNGRYTYRNYQDYCLTGTLDKILNKKITSKDDEVSALSEFLSYVWGLERINLKPEFNKVGGGTDMKAVYALYPSSGGGVTPLSLIRSTEGSLDIRFNNYVDNDFKLGTNANNSALHTLLYKNPNSNQTRDYMKVDKISGTLGDDMVGGAPYFSIGGGKGYGEGPKSRITNFIDEDALNKFDKLLSKNNVSKYNKNFKFSDNPLSHKYYVEPSYDTNTFLSRGFDNIEVLKNTTRFFWFDPTMYGIDLKPQYKVDNNLNATIPDLSLENGVDKMISSFGEKDYFSLNMVSVFTSGDYEKLKEQYFFEQYTLTNLMDSLDFEKLDKFKDLFIDFSKLNGKSSAIYNEANHTLRSLMLSSSCITYDDFEDVSFAGKTWSKDEINLMLIGNSLFQYEFLSESGISNILNYSLSKAQYKITNNVIDEFCSSLVTVANFSPSTPISTDKNGVSSLHRVIGVPEILFSNRPSYDEILTLLEKTTDDDKNKMGVYFARKILFGDQYIDPFTALSKDELTTLGNLNYKYLLNKLYTYKKFDGDLNELYKKIVINFFELLNVKFTTERYKQLHRLIRTYVYRILKNNDILNEKSLSNNERYLYQVFPQFKTDFNIG